MKAHISIMGCKVELNNVLSQVVLNPCNCSTYFKLMPDAVPLTKELHVCDFGLLWNHKISECQQKDAIVKGGICDPEKPWERCMDSSGAVKHVCISERLFNMSSSTAMSVTLSPSAQQANLELAMTSMVAGSVITLMLVAIIWTFCNRQTMRMPIKLWTLLKDRQKKEKTEKPLPTVTGGDNVSVVYEDIDEEEDGYMAPEVRGGNSANLPPTPEALSCNKPTPHPPRKPPHALVSKKVEPTSSEIRESETVGKSTGIGNAAPPKIQHAEGSGLKMVPKPTGSSPKVPQKPPKSTKLPKDTKTPASPPVQHKKVTKTLTEDESYIHPVSP